MSGFIELMFGILFFFSCCFFCSADTLMPLWCDDVDDVRLRKWPIFIRALDTRVVRELLAVHKIGRTLFALHCLCVCVCVWCIRYHPQSQWTFSESPRLLLNVENALCFCRWLAEIFQFNFSGIWTMLDDSYCSWWWLFGEHTKCNCKLWPEH